jgi:hypothetical protein
MTVMHEQDSFRLWKWTQERRDAFVFWGTLVLAGIAYAIPEIFQ